MNTKTNTSKIFEKLAKVKEAKAKQEFGAIEDAINEVKNKIESLETEMYDLLNNFNNELDNSKSIIMNEIETVKDYSFDYENEFGFAKSTFEESLSELKSAGIEYDESTANKIISDFENSMNTLQNILALSI